MLRRCWRAGLAVMLLVSGVWLANASANASQAPPATGVTAAQRTADGGSSAAAAKADVNGDGIADLVAASAARVLPDYGKAPDIGGSVYVIPGGVSLPGAATSLITQDSLGVPDESQAGDGFGFSLATGDFNKDGLADVAIGAPFEDVRNSAGVLQKDAGAVTIMYGIPSYPYLETRGLAQIVQTTAINSAPEPGDRFGLSLSTGDYNGDGCADLTIGTPYEAIGTKADAGALYVLYGSQVNGITTTGAGSIDGDHAGVGAAEPGDHFAWALASGDVTGDGLDDLAFTVQSELVTGIDVARGDVLVYKGTTAGLTATGVSHVNVASTNTLEKLDTLTIGKFRGPSAPADVVVHAGRIAGGPPADSGALVLLQGGIDGVNPTRVTTISQDTPDISGLDKAEAGDLFGLTLATGDLNKDGFADLAAGVPGEDAGRGAASVFYGGAGGIFAANDFFFNEATPGVGGKRKIEEYFGRAVRILDIDGDTTPELVVTAHREDQAYETAAAHVIDLTGAGTTATVTATARYNRDALFARSCLEDAETSCFGPGFPIAGAASGPLETTAGPYRTARRLGALSVRP